MKRLVGGQLLLDISNHPLDTDAGEESITDADILKQLTELKSFIDGKDIKPALVKYVLSSDDTIGIVNANVLYDDANKKMTIAGVSTQNGGTPLTIVINVTFTFEEFDGYVVDTATIYATYSLVVEDVVEFGGDVEIDGDLQVNSKATFEDDVVIKGNINDSNGDEAIDIGTEDVSIHKNVNIGSVDEPEDLFVSGDLQKDTDAKIINLDDYEYDSSDNIYTLSNIPNGKYHVAGTEAEHSSAYVDITFDKPKLLLYPPEMNDAISANTTSYVYGYGYERGFVLSISLNVLDDYSIAITDEFVILSLSLREK